MGHLARKEERDAAFLKAFQMGLQTLLLTEIRNVK